MRDSNRTEQIQSKREGVKQKKLKQEKVHLGMINKAERMFWKTRKRKHFIEKFFKNKIYINQNGIEKRQKEENSSSFMSVH